MNNDLLKAIQMIKEGLKIINDFNHNEIEEGLKIGDEIDEYTYTMQCQLSYLEDTLKEL